MQETQYIQQEYKKPQSLFDLLSIEPPKQKSLLAEFIDEAFERCNASRVMGGYKPLAKRVYAVRINLCCPTDTEIHYLMQACRRGNYSKVFFGATKSKKVVK